MNKKFEHLQNLTVGEYFAKHIITDIVEKINNAVDINKLNDHLRVLAMEGKKNAKPKNVKKQCKLCDKSFAKKSNLVAHKYVHKGDKDAFERKLQDSDLIFECQHEHCGKRFISEGILKYHI